jgi:hypothetical protein
LISPRFTSAGNAGRPAILRDRGSDTADQRPAQSGGYVYQAQNTGTSEVRRRIHGIRRLEGTSPTAL